MPPDVFLTYAKDYAIESSKSLTYLVDVNTFGRFHTFQLQKPLGDHDLSEKEKPSGLSTRFSIPSNQAQDGLIFRLRAELITPQSSSGGVRQGLRISLIEESSGIIVEASTLEQHEVVLQYDNIEQGKEYTIRYDLYDKEISVGTTTQNGECSFPQIAQQMLIMDKRLVQHRIDSYLADQTLSESDLQKDGLICDFGSLSNEDTVFSFFNIESILYCDTHTYTYNSQKSLQNTVLYSRDFQVKGLNSTGRTLITYWFDMSIALNFMASSGFKVLLAKGDYAFEKSQFACLRDRSCVMAHMSDKNVLRVEAILTSGNYKIMIIDYNTEDSYAMLNAMRKPVNIKIQANTIIQNEERVNCPYLYLEEDFIQSKFLDGMSGQKFSFQDTIIMNVFNLSQPISLKPERDMLLKVLVKESFGVNSELSLSDGDGVIAKSVQMGSTEIMVHQRLKKGSTYTLTLSYFNSIIQMAQFYQCPSLPIEVTMIECEEAEAVAREHGKISDEENFKTEEALNAIFNTIDGLRSKQREIWEDGYTFTNHSVVFNSQLNLDKTEQTVISRLLTVGPERMQLLAEIYFEPYLLYMLDVSIKSKDIEKMHHQQVLQQSSEGSKRILVELEPGDYEFMITYKNPITRDNNTFPIPESVKYQLMIVYDDLIDRQQILPPSLNYYGMLGPQGRDFGQMVYFCGDCIMEYSQFKVIEFQSYSEINFDAIISSPTNSLEVKLEEVITEEEVPEQKDTYYKSFEKAVKKGKSMGSRLIRDRGKKSLQREEVIKANNLSGMKKYRVVITVKNTDIDLAQEYKFNLRIEIQDKPKEYKWLQSQFDILPKSIEEIARYKLKNEGMKESDFLVASATTLNFLDENKLHPFLRMTQDKVYQMNIDSKITDDGSFLYYLPFTIDTEEAIVYASVYDYSGQAGLGVNILKDSSDEEEESFEAVSIPGKYFNYIPPLALSKGTYYLGILPQTTITQTESTLIRFSLDLLIEKEDTARGFSNELLEGAMQFCSLPQNPRYLSSPAYMHPLSGQSMSAIINVKASDFISGDMIEFEIKEDTYAQSLQKMTMVQAYIEFPRDMRLEMSVMKGFSVLKQKASWEDLNSESENFLKTKTFSGKNYIQIREVIAGKGLYRILIKGQDTKGMGLLEQFQRCETLKISLNIYPISPIATKSKLTDLCPQAHGFENQLDFAKDLRGEVLYSTSANILDTSYISTSGSIFGMPPYLFYVNLQYDMALQGHISIALFKYDKETLQFEEDELFTSHQHGSQLLARIEDDGTYIIAIQSLTSTVDVFNLDTKIRDVQRPVLFKPCINIKYEAIISSMAEESFYTNLNFEQITTLERLLPEKQQSCMLDTMPESFPVSETGFDISFNLPFEQKPEDLVDIVTSGNQTSLLKVMIYSYKNPQSNINAFLYKNQAALEPPYNANASLARSVLTFDEKVLFAILPQQRQPYKLKVVYDTSLNQKDCNTFLMRAAQKDLQTVISDNLQCTGLGMPPEQIDVDKEVFDFEGSFEVSSEFLLKFKQNSDITYDIKVKVPSNKQQYFFDIETKSDYLVSDVETELYLNEIYLGDTNFVPQREHQNGLAVKRMKVDCAKDQLGEVYVIRITFSRLMVKLATYLKDQTKEPLCFAFDLSLRVSKPMFEETYYERETEANENELVRIDWESQHAHNAYTIGGGLIVDPSQKVIGYLEFKESLKESITLARSDYFIRLVSMNETDGVDISVQNQRLSPFDSSTLIFEIAHNTLKPVGYCYRVELVGAIFISRHNSEDTTIPGQIICTTKCEGCNPSGTKGCKEAQGKCLCNSVFTGDRCDQCIPGHIMDPATKLCNPENKCKSEGGKEDCNGHGECVTDPQNGQAKCLCDPGFENNGLDLCGKCEDAFFQYPNCMQRFWAVLMGSYNCMDMQTEMPTYLYKQNNEEKVYQQADGSLYWNALYRLDSGMRKKQHQQQQSFISEHFFKVPPGDNAIIRVFLDTHDSQGIKNVEVRILDGEKRIMHDTREKESSIVDTSESSKTFFMMIEQEEDESQKPWTIEFQYQMDSSSQSKDIEYASTQCPFIEVIVILQPFTKLQDYLTCTSTQLSHLLDSENLPTLQLSENFKYHTKNFTLTSSDALKQQLNPSFYILSQNLSISQLSKDVTHALSIFTSYSFESVHVQMSLRDSLTGSVIAIDRLSYIEEVEISEQQQYGNLDKHDMLSLIEVADIPAGQYTLDIAIDKAMFIPMKNTRTCLEFDLTIEYVSIPKTKDPNRYDIVSIMPQKAKGLTNSSEIKIIVTFNKDLVLEDLIPGGNFNQDLGRLCYMQNKNTHLDAKKAFKKNDKVIEFYYNFRGVEITEECFTLKCGVVSGNYFTTYQEATSDASIEEITIENEYCLIGSKNLNCNPNSMPRIVDGLCKCIYPYTGPTCEQCDSTFLQTTDSNSHTVCTVDISKCNNNGDVCHNHGRCEKTNNEFVSCKCEERYSGRYCERCKNRADTYPDCDGEVQFAEKALPPYMTRQKYSNNEKVITKDQQQCLFSNYPKDLNRLEYMQFLPQSGDFHIADIYTVNHNSDNVITFKAPTIGEMKILVQKPELESLSLEDEAFDFEIGIYDLENDKFLATSTNQYIDLDNHQEGLIKDKESVSIDGKLDFSVLTFKIPDTLVNHTLQIRLRTANTSESSSTPCTTVYLELQFKSGPPPLCQQPNNIAHLTSSNDIIRISNPFTFLDASKEYFVHSMNPHFFYYQDFYIESDIELHLSIYQKFADQAMVDFVVEILEMELDEPQTNFFDTEAPQCINNPCFIGGQKAYNEFHNYFEIGPKTVFRVWFFKHTDHGTNDCGKFQVQLEFLKPQPKPQSTNKCSSLDFPLSLNTSRYSSNSFHYLESFRVDNLPNTTHHTLEFTLTEPSMVRFVSVQHRHIEFDLELYSGGGSKLVSSGAKGFEDSIYAQLDKGTYWLKVIFLSEAYYMGQPCQTIEMEIAIDSISKVREQVFKEADNSKGISKFDGSYQTISPKIRTQAYLLNKEDTKSLYKSYEELETIKFTVPGDENLGLLIELKSNFLTADVSLGLSKGDQFTHQQRFYNSKKLAVSNLKGDYELMIYAHQALSNLNKESDLVKDVLLQYEISWQFVKLSEIDDFSQHSIEVTINSNNVTVPLITLDSETFSLMSSTFQLPSTLSPLTNNGALDIDNFFLAQPGEHPIIFTPHQDSLSVIIYAANSLAQLYQHDKLIQESISASGEISVLTVNRLYKDEEYRLVLVFDEETNSEPIRIQIKSFDYNEACNRKQLINDDDKSIVIGSDENKSATISSGSKKSAQGSIELKDGGTLEVVIDTAQVEYMPVFKLSWKKLPGGISPSDIDTSISGIIRYTFTDLKASTYTYTLSHIRKPNSCSQSIHLTFKSYSSNSEIDFQSEVYQSNEEIEKQNRYREPLPLSLDTYKFLKDQHDYALVSEYLQMQPSNPESNIIKFTIENDQTLVKFNIETPHITMTLRDQFGQTVNKATSPIIQSLLQKGTYALHFEYSTLYASTLQSSAFHLSILILEKQFLTSKILPQTIDSHSECASNKNFPLSLNRKKTQIQDEIAYDYQLLRLSGEVVQGQSYLDRYAFRINGTSRFYVALGYEAMAANVRLRLTDLKEGGVSWIGAQMFGQSVIDDVIGAGDYALIIEQAEIPNGALMEQMLQGTNYNKLCSLFSLSGLITPIIESGRGNALASDIGCPIKEVLPSKIYKSSADTKDGMENYINQDGTYTRVFRRLLVKKSLDQSRQYDTISLESPHPSLLSVLVQYPHHQTVITPMLTYSYGSTQLAPLASTHTLTSHGFIEATYLFTMEANTGYRLHVMYQGEIASGKRKCEYYNALISINTVERASKELTCLPEADTKDVRSLVNEIPDKIEEGSYQDYIKVVYPNDFTTDMLNKSISIYNRKNDPLEIEVDIKFDYPYSMFAFQLVEHLNEEDGDDEPVLQNPLMVDRGDDYSPVLNRKIHSSRIEPKKEYSLQITDQLSFKLMEYISQQSKLPQLCIYSEFSLTLSSTKPTQQLFQSSSSIPPQILSVSPQPPQKGGNLLIQQGINQIQLTVSFSSIPFLVSASDKQRFNPSDFSKLVSLQVFHPDTSKLLRAIPPMRITNSTNQGVFSVKLTFSLKDELDSPKLFSLALNPNKTVDSRNRPFTLAPNVKLPTFLYEGAQDSSMRKRNEATKVTGEIDQIKQKETKKNKEQVKCLCVHGKCKQGESTCYKCDMGWTGTLCDITLNSAKVVNQEKGEKKWSNVRKDGTRLNRDRRDDDDGEESRKVYKEVIATKTTRNSIIDRDTQTKIKQIYEEASANDQTNEEGFFSYLFYLLQWAFIIVIAGFLVFKILENRRTLSQYMPVNLNDFEAEPLHQEFNQLTELTDYKQQKKHQSTPGDLPHGSLPMNIQSLFSNHRNQQRIKSPPQPQNQQSPMHLQEESDRLFEEQTKQLSSELQLYSQEEVSSGHNPFDEYVEHARVQPEHDIDSVLQEMEEFTADANDDDNEFSKFV